MLSFFPNCKVTYVFCMCCNNTLVKESSVVQCSLPCESYMFNPQQKAIRIIKLNKCTKEEAQRGDEAGAHSLAKQPASSDMEVFCAILCTAQITID